MSTTAVEKRLQFEKAVVDISHLLKIMVLLHIIRTC